MPSIENESGENRGRAFHFERTRTSYAIEIDDSSFLKLLDSESYVSGNAAFKPGNDTLDGKLMDTGAADVEYNGHYGTVIYLSLDVDDDTEENRAEIVKIIEDHLAWCAEIAALQTADPASK